MSKNHLNPLIYKYIYIYIYCICSTFDWKYSFQYTWRKLVHLSSLAFSTHPSYHHTIDFVFCYFYKNLDEKRSQTIYLWQQRSPSTWIDVDTIEYINITQFHITLIHSNFKLHMHMFEEIVVLFPKIDDFETVTTLNNRYGKTFFFSDF